MTEEELNEPIIVVTTSDNYIIAVGAPQCFKSKDVAEYIKDGCSIVNMKFREYKELKTPWIFDKPKETQK